jgi:hypothetical protein
MKSKNHVVRLPYYAVAVCICNAFSHRCDEEASGHVIALE